MGWNEMKDHVNEHGLSTIQQNIQLMEKKLNHINDLYKK